MKLLLLTAFCLTVTTGHAIVLSSGTAQTSRHQQPECIQSAALAEGSAPSPFPFWENIGTVGMGTGLYLGHGWVLTSTHVGCLPFRLSDGTYYRPILGTWRILVNPDGTKSDVALFRVNVGGALSALRALPEITLSTSTPGSNTPVVLVGTGFVEREHSADSASVHFGFYLRSLRAKRWAMVTMDKILETPASTAGGLKTQCFVTTFRDRAFGGQAAEGDSGGPAFVFDEGDRRWKLAGCIFAVSQLDNFVPYGARTYVGDLASYSAQIDERIGRSTILAAR